MSHVCFPPFCIHCRGVEESTEPQKKLCSELIYRVTLAPCFSALPHQDNHFPRLPCCFGPVCYPSLALPLQMPTLSSRLFPLIPAFIVAVSNILGFSLCPHPAGCLEGFLAHPPMCCCLPKRHSGYRRTNLISRGQTPSPKAYRPLSARPSNLAQCPQDDEPQGVPDEYGLEMMYSFYFPLALEE
jgi:hypothetical protein